MLRVYFGDRKNSIYNTSVYFNHSYQEDWITDDFGRAVISDVDHSEVLSGHNIAWRNQPQRAFRRCKDIAVNEALPRENFQRLKLRG